MVTSYAGFHLVGHREPAGGHAHKHVATIGDLAIEFHLLFVGRDAKRSLPADCRTFFFDVQRVVEQAKPFINQARRQF